MNNKTPNYPIKILTKTFSVLDVLLEHESPMSISRISEKLDFYPSTVHRILDTLKYGGYVKQNPINQKYQLGLKLLELGMAKLQQIDLVKEAKPFLKELAKKCNETVHLGILEDIHVLYLAKEESSRTIRMISYVGRRAPIHCTALGKVLLAYLPLDTKNKILDKIELYPRTDNTITNRDYLEKECNVIKKEGFAVDNEEYERNLYCIATPIFDHQGEVTSAISFSIPGFRIKKENINNLKKDLLATSRKISYNLGFQ